MKKILLVLLSFVFVTCLFAGCGGSGGGGSVRFDDLSETVEYGDVYILAKTVEANGSTYEAEAVVNDSKGQEVAVFGGRFDVFDIDGYTIYYSAYDGDKSVGKWKVTLKVNMAVKPTVEIDEDFSTVNSYEIGEEFLLPVVRYYSAISENLNKTDNLYKVASGSEIAVAFADGKFTPEADGNYVYRVKVTDEFGNENLIEYAFSIRNLPAEQEVEAFDHFGSANNVSTKTGAMGFEATDYCYKEIGGKTGSIKLTVKAQWPQFYV
ncbi:MAG: hypothetical protein IJ800_06845, partial [Clostridia bacterium]|nr:hypothetical protein [Clostridia bacterium]